MQGATLPHLPPTMILHAPGWQITGRKQWIESGCHSCYNQEPILTLDSYSLVSHSEVVYFWPPGHWFISIMFESCSKSTWSAWVQHGLRLYPPISPHTGPKLSIDSLVADLIGDRPLRFCMSLTMYFWNARHLFYFYLTHSNILSVSE